MAVHKLAVAGKTDPLLAAVIDKLPPAGQSWPRADRVAWLELIVKAFDVAYGREDAIDLPAFLAPLSPYDENSPEAKAIRDFPRTKVMIAKALAAAPAAVASGRPAQAHAGHNFYIAADGTACDAGGEPVSLADIPADETIFDYRPVAGGEFRDTAGIVWADGARGILGIAPGVSFCGPGAAA
jgi:hypothetical protein